MGAARRNIACNGSPRFAFCALRFKDPLPPTPPLSGRGGAEHPRPHSHTTREKGESRSMLWFYNRAWEREKYLPHPVTLLPYPPWGIMHVGFRGIPPLFIT
jgi:hypothetical protein